MHMQGEARAETEITKTGSTASEVPESVDAYVFAFLRPVFRGYTVVWCGCLEYALTLTISGLLGSPRLSIGRCFSFAVVMLVAYFIYVSLLIWMRPCTTPLGNAVAILSEGLCFCNCVLLLVSLALNDQRIADVMRFISIASYAVMWLQVIPAAVEAVRVMTPILRKLAVLLRRLLMALRDCLLRTLPSFLAPIWPRGDAECTFSLDERYFESPPHLLKDLSRDEELLQEAIAIEALRGDEAEYSTDDTMSSISDDAIMLDPIAMLGTAEVDDAHSLLLEFSTRNRDTSLILDWSLPEASATFDC